MIPQAAAARSKSPSLSREATPLPGLASEEEEGEEDVPESVPEVEWWDKNLLVSGSYERDVIAVLEGRAVGAEQQQQGGAEAMQVDEKEGKQQQQQQQWLQQAQKEGRPAIRANKVGG